MKLANIRDAIAKPEREPSRRILDHKGREVGHVGAGAHEGAVSRILGHRNVKFDGKDWRAKAPPKPARVSVVPVDVSRNQAKGSVNKTLAEVSAMGATTAKVGGGQS